LDFGLLDQGYGFKFFFVLEKKTQSGIGKASPNNLEKLIQNRKSKIQNRLSASTGQLIQDLCHTKLVNSVWARQQLETTRK
jgi:hypothetical protein